MRTRLLGNLPKVGTSVLVAALVGAMAFAISGTLTHAANPRFSLTSGSGFTITSTVDAAYPACTPATKTATLALGVTRCLALMVHNPLAVTLKVTTLSVTPTSFTPKSTNPSLPKCTTTMLGSIASATTFTVPANGTKVVDRQLVLTDTTTNQDNCKGGTFHFSYAGHATFTDSTTTVLTSSPNPSSQGSAVTFTATVTGKDPTFDSSKPAGSVTFYSCTTVTCSSKSSLATETVTQSTGKATYTTTSLSVGTHYIEAVYTGTTTDYSQSTSTVLTQTVTTTTTPQCITTPVHGSVKVKSGQVVCIETTVIGLVDVAPGGGVIIKGATIDGGVHTRGATQVRICSSTVRTGLYITGSTGPVVIGSGNDTCGANTLYVAVLLTNNTGGIEMVGNTIVGVVDISGNKTTGVNEVGGNTITGALTCSTTNSPPLTDGGHPNSVSGTRYGQCAGGSF